MADTQEVLDELTKKATFADAVLALVREHGYMPKRARAKVKVKEVVRFRTRLPRGAKKALAAAQETPPAAA